VLKAQDSALGPRREEDRLQRYRKRFFLPVAAVLAIGLCVQVLAKGKVKQLPVPVVIEKATVRGKVVVLESRRRERRTIKDLRIQIWAPGEDGKEASLVHETKTDEAGMFDLPILKVAEYSLRVGEIDMKLKVTEQAPDRAGRAEPKVLLIMLPKEVVSE